MTDVLCVGAIFMVAWAWYMLISTRQKRKENPWIK